MGEEITPNAIGEELSKSAASKRARIGQHLGQAALGAIPWLGGFLAAIIAIRASADQAATDEMQRQWIEQHEEKLRELAAILHGMTVRFEDFGEQVEKRIQSREYLEIVRRGFKDWDDAATAQKRNLIVRLMTNAAISEKCSDDVIRLFQDWIQKYHEIHFAVIAEIYKNRGFTRGQIWRQIRGQSPREDSAEADLFKLLIRDLSTGSIIRQHRPTSYSGEFYKKQPTKKVTSGVMKSAFDNDEPYELTQLGEQFVHYLMEELVTRLSEAR